MKELYIFLLLLKYQRYILTIMILILIILAVAAVVSTRKYREEIEPNGRYTKKQAEKEKERQGREPISENRAEKHKAWHKARR